MDKARKTYWDHEDFASPYQMGSQKHRVYLLDKLKQLEVKSLLDVGCGTGPIYEMITTDSDGRWDNILRYRGIDYSWQMIETAQEVMPFGDFKVGDARKIEEPDESYDCVLLMHALDHLDDYKAAIAEAARVSKKYVTIILWRSFVNEGTHLNDRNMYGKKEDEEPWEDTHLQEYSKDALIEEFKKYDLVDVDYNDGPDVNDEGKHNLVWILKKAGVAEETEKS